MKALFLLADGFDDLSLFVPWFRLKEEGLDTFLAAPAAGPVSGKHGYRASADLATRDVDTGEYDLVVIPDGPAVEKLRVRGEVVDVARTFADEGKLVGCLGHGAQLLISAGSLDGRTVTCSPGIRDDVKAAGALYRDEGTILDGMLLTCRGPNDLPEFTRRLVALLRSPAAARV